MTHKVLKQTRDVEDFKGSESLVEADSDKVLKQTCDVEDFKGSESLEETDSDTQSTEINM